MGDMVIPHCEHGNIVLGCQHDHCAVQNAYLSEQEEALKRYENMMLNNARRLMRPWAADWSR